MRGFHSLGEHFRNLRAILGAPGLMIGGFSLLSFAFGLFVLAREYDRPERTARHSLQRVLEDWVRSPDYLGLTLVDHADRWRHAPTADRDARLRILQEALERLGSDLDQFTERFPLIAVTSLELREEGERSLARWMSPSGTEAGARELADPIRLTRPGDSPTLELRLTYRAAPALGEGVRNLESTYQRLLLALAGLSGFPLLCLAYMILHAHALSERVAREAAREATLDLADRTCHELGNGVFVLANERRNLAGHLDLIERFLDEDPTARAAAARRAGVEPQLAQRWERAMRSEYESRGIDPELELRASLEVARHVCRQIESTSRYLDLTVRELDGFLKHSDLPVLPESVGLIGCFEETTALLRPRLEAASADVAMEVTPPDLTVLADRRLLIHALVNLVKNAIEAAESASRQPRVILGGAREGRTVWLTVDDNGPGIPVEQASRIFQGGYTTKGAGHGRGLTIVRESIQLQGGRILVEPSPGGGASFRIALRAGD